MRPRTLEQKISAQKINFEENMSFFQSEDKKDRENPSFQEIIGGLY